jgi:ankyrin repeat protein
MANSSQSSFNGDDFSNNLFTDLGPLLALFGAEVTTQFLSQSLTWADSILFAIGPLGVITAMVSAIRVGGPYGLRSFIGRAREPRAEVERVLMSSTSKEVCELWNGESLVRVTGEPKVAELLVVFGEDCKRPPKSQGWGIYLKEECELVKVKGQDAQAAASSKASSTDEKGNGEACSPDTSIKENQDEEKRRNNLPYSKQPELNSLTAPNISLNHSPSRNSAEVILFSAVAIVLQAVVLLLDAFITYRWKLLKEGEPVTRSAFPLVLAGTVGLTAGMFVCSAVVEKSAKIVWYSLQSPQPVKLLWLQKKSVVSDQNFESYAIFAEEGRRAIVSSTRQAYFQPDREELDNAVLEDFTLQMFSINLVTTGGVLLSLVSYVVQFVGFRQMHWLATIFQLILSVTMTAIRSWVRRDLSRQPFNQKLPEGYELDWLATRHRLYEPSDRTDYTSKTAISLSSLGNAMRSTQRAPYALSMFLHERVLWTRRKPRAWYGTDADRFEWFIVDSCISDMMSGTTGQDTTDPSASSADHKAGSAMVKEITQPNTAEAVLGVRQRLGHLIGWKSPVEEVASSLVCAIEAMMNHVSNEALFTLSVQTRTNFVWGIQVGEAKETVYLQVLNENGLWRANASQIEATLSLWTYELSLAERALHQAPGSYHVMNIWRLGPKSSHLERDCAWWVFRGSKLQSGPQPSCFLGRPGWPEVVEIGNQDATILREFGLGTAVKYGQDNGNDGGSLSVLRNSDISVLKMCAWHLLTVFMCWVSEAIAEVKGSTSFNLRCSQWDILPGWLHDSVNLVNSSLQSLAAEVEASRLCNLEEAYMIIVPPLSMAGKLPRPMAVIGSALQVARSFEKQQNWKAAADVYVDLLQTCRSFGASSEMLAKASAVSAEFFTLLAHAEETYEIRADEDAIGEIKRFRNSMETEIKRGDRNLLRSLAALYRFQRDAREVQTLSKAPSSSPMKQSDARRIRQESLQAQFWVWTELFHDVAGNNLEKLHQHLKEASDLSLNAEHRDILGWSALHYAAQQITENPEDEGNCLRALLRRSLDPNCQNVLGQTPLHCAARAEIKSSIDILVQYGASMDAKSVDGKTALHIAVRSRDKNLVSILCEKGADIEARDNFEQTPLHVAALAGSVDAVLLLLDWQAKPRVREGSGLTPLHAICGQRRTTRKVGEVVNRFLEAGAALDATDREGRSPLHFAARSGCVEALEALLPETGRRANLLASDASGMIPFHVAAKYCTLHAAKKVLASASTDMPLMIEARDQTGKTPLHHTVNGAHVKISDRLEFVKFLLERRVDVNARDEDGMTPLHCCKDREVVKVLLKNRANIHARDSLGRKPLHCALDPEVIQELLEAHGKDKYRDMRELEDKEGMTPLHRATMSASVAAIKIHLQDGAPVNVGDQNGKTPLHLAIQGDDNRDVFKLLLQNAAPEAEDDGGRTVLELAVELKKRDAVVDLLNWEVQVRPKALHMAARSGDAEIMKLLLENKSIHMNEENDSGMTPLHLAVEHGNMAVADLLVERGADLSKKNMKGQTPVELIRTPQTRESYRKKWFVR